MFHHWENEGEEFPAGLTCLQNKYVLDWTVPKCIHWSQMAQRQTSNSSPLESNVEREQIQGAAFAHATHAWAAEGRAQFPANVRLKQAQVCTNFKKKTFPGD